MSEQVNCLDTSRVPRGERLALWGQALSGLSGILHNGNDPLRVDGYNAETIDGQIETTHIGGITFSRIEASPHRIAQPAVDQRRVINVLLQIFGTSVLEQGGRRIETSPGDCLIGDLSQSRQLLNPTGTKHLLIVIPGETAFSNGLGLHDSHYQCFSSSRGLGRLSRNLVETIIEDRAAIGAEYERDMADMVMRLLRLSLLASEEQFVLGARQRLVQQAKSFVDKNIRDPDLDLHQVAHALNCSPRYLHTAFAAEGTSITKYIWSARLELCHQELIRTRKEEMTVTDIAFACGFNSSSHFSRTFKEKFGVSPSKLRR